MEHNTRLCKICKRMKHQDSKLAARCKTCDHMLLFHADRGGEALTGGNCFIVKCVCEGFVHVDEKEKAKPRHVKTLDKTDPRLFEVEV